MSRLLFAPAAVEDLSEIHYYIARDNPDAARTLIVDVRERCAALNRQPEMGTMRDDLLPGLRMFTLRRTYVILYRISGDDVEVMRVVHSSLDFGQLF